MKYRNFLLLVALLLLPFGAAAQNPISPMGVYIADPTARVWQKDGRLEFHGGVADKDLCAVDKFRFLR